MERAVLFCSPPDSGCHSCVALQAMTLSLLMYPMLRSLALQLHSAITGSYISGTHSILFSLLCSRLPKTLPVLCKSGAF
uniref:Uncharacterized protein n=1 Tax=Pavo cristatus TaxID=9049 RepID=A0A8C9FVT8_PAVCR